MPRPLRIVLCCQQSARRHAVPAYAFWAEYFRGALAEAGHACIEVPECDWAAGLLPADQFAADDWADRTWTAAIEFIRREHAREPVDFLLGYFFPRQVLPSAIAQIRQLGIPCVNFFCDNVREFLRVPSVYHGFDLHWVPEYKALAIYARAGLPALHAPMACWVPPAQRAPVPKETLPVTFIGTRDLQRERLFAEAITHGLHVELRGTGWANVAATPGSPPARAKNLFTLLQRQLDFARQHGCGALVRKHLDALRPPPPLEFDFTPHARPAPVDDAYWPVLRQSLVCIGVNRYPSFRFPLDHPGSYSRLRDIEAPMAGACYLTEWTEGLDLLYEPGVEIETYGSVAELVDKAAELSADAPRRARLRAAGQRRALSDHTIPRTIELISQRLGCAR